MTDKGRKRGKYWQPNTGGPAIVGNVFGNVGCFQRSQFPVLSTSLVQTGSNWELGTELGYGTTDTLTAASPCLNLTLPAVSIRRRVRCRRSIRIARKLPTNSTANPTFAAGSPSERVAGSVVWRSSYAVRESCSSTPIPVRTPSDALSPDAPRIWALGAAQEARAELPRRNVRRPAK